MNFKHCLRITIVPDLHQSDRIKNVIQFCKKYGFCNVMLFINAEELNLGHMTIEEAKPWVETMQKAKEALNRENISVSLNMWITMGHLARGRTLKDGQNFVTQKDMHGLSSELVACPLCESFLKYYFELSKFVIEALKPDVFWVEDDFRMHNHYPLDYGGCFCDLHMTKYNKHLNKNLSREEFAKKVFEEGGLNEERKAWFEVNREIMADYAKKLGKFVKEIDPKIETALMSSLPYFHAMEYRDWHRVTENLACGGRKINRIHLPCYQEVCGKNYGFQFAANSMLVRAMLPFDTEILPEFENGAFSTYVKDARFLRFQLESSIPLLPVGMTYDIFDFVGNGTIDSFGYGEEIKDLTPYLDGIINLGLKFENQEGIIIPFDEKASFYKEIKRDFEWTNLWPDEWQIAGYLTGSGFNCRFEKKRVYKNQMVALTGNTVNYFDDNELTKLFEDNFILLDGSAAEILQKRNMLSLIGCKSVKRFSPQLGNQSFEEASDEIVVDGIKNYRASSQEKAGDYFDCDISNVKTFTFVKNRHFETVGKGISLGKNFLLNPYGFEGIPYTSCNTQSSLLFPFLEQFHSLRIAILRDALTAQKTDTKLIFSDYAGVLPYVYKKDDKLVLMLINSTVQTLKEINLTASFEKIRKIEIIGKNGKIKKVNFEMQRNKILIKQSLEYLSTATFLMTL